MAETQTVKKSTVHPTGDRVLVRRIEEEDTTPSGLTLPETSKDKPQRGEVLEVGPGKITEKGTRQPMEYKVGDKIIFTRYAGVEVKMTDGETLLILPERDILAVSEF